ncbi:MAG: hypothetical protein Q7R47_05060 [Candidatus Diapherotrites archaeon]|nr:hypothetical protein [Candidatus Diapherotrites archaeon]
MQISIVRKSVEGSRNLHRARENEVIGVRDTPPPLPSPCEGEGDQDVSEDGSGRDMNVSDRHLLEFGADRRFTNHIALDTYDRTNNVADGWNVFWDLALGVTEETEDEEKKGEGEDATTPYPSL